MIEGPTLTIRNPTNRFVPKVALALQVFYAVLVMFFAAYSILAVDKAAEAASKPNSGFDNAIEVIAILVLEVLPCIAAFFLWRRKRFGWRLSVGIDALISLVAAVILISDLVCGSKVPLAFNAGMLVVAIFFASIVGLLLSSASRTFFFRPSGETGNLSV
jgi:hypothetical protein